MLGVVIVIILIFFVLIFKRRKKGNRQVQQNEASISAENTNKEAIRAAEFLNRPINVMDDDKTKRDAEYEIVLKEHERLIEAIHVPEAVTPCDVDLTPTEKVFLWYLNGKPVRRPNIAVYWFIEYGLHDYQNCVQKLFDGGYLTVAAPAESLSMLTKQQLNEILDDYALPKTGRKADLVQRIVETIPEEAINSIYKDIVRFAFTPRGHQEVNNAYSLVYFHQHRSHVPGGFSLDDVDYIVNKFPRLSPDEILLLLPEIYERARQNGCLTMENISLEELLKSK